MNQAVRDGLCFAFGWGCARYTRGRYTKGWSQVVTLKDENNRAVYDLLLERPGRTQTQVLAGVPAGWSRARLQKVLRVLKSDGLLHEQREGRCVFYWAVPLPASVTF